MHRHLLIAAASGLALSAASAQEPFGPRPAVTVTAFDFGTVAAYGTAGRGRYPRPSAHPDAELAAEFISAVGTGVSDLVVERLIESQRFRVYERRQLDAVEREHAIDAQDSDEIERARYVITGSISLLGNDDQDISGAIAGVAAGAVGLGTGFHLGALNTSSTTMRVTVRVVDTRTGEIIGGFTSEGKSRKRWGGGFLSVGSGGIKGAQVNNKNFRETAIGEAGDRAAMHIVERLIAMRAQRLRP